MGLCSYYKRYVKGFSEKARPLGELMRKDKEFEWGPRKKQAFETLKQKMITAPVLKHLEGDKPFIMDPDASEHTLRGVIGQRDSAGNEHPVAFYSRTLTPPERNYLVTEKEGLAAVEVLKKHRPMLLGSSKITIRTDHQPLKWMLTDKR